MHYKAVLVYVTHILFTILQTWVTSISNYWMLNHFLIQKPQNCIC